MVEFYDTKTRRKVSLSDREVTKSTFRAPKGEMRYGIRGKTSDGRMLTKFVSKSEWDELDIPEEK